MDSNNQETLNDILLMIIYWTLSAFILVTFIHVFPNSGVTAIGMAAIIGMCISYQVCKLLEGEQ